MARRVLYAVIIRQLSVAASCRLAFRVNVAQPTATRAVNDSFDIELGPLV